MKRKDKIKNVLYVLQTLKEQEDCPDEEFFCSERCPLYHVKGCPCNSNIRNFGNMKDYALSKVSFITTYLNDKLKPTESEIFEAVI